MNKIIKSILKLRGLVKVFILAQLNKWKIKDYLKSDRRPWRQGYLEYRNQYLSKIIQDTLQIDFFREGKDLAKGYGFRLDARVVEIPWVYSRIPHGAGNLLDAGSSLNQKVILTLPQLNNKKATIVTLAPERECHWKLGVSYVYGDLRNLDFRDEFFDTVTCISTIEHIGMDNEIYTGDSNMDKSDDTRDFIAAIVELKRVLKPKGVLYVTFPFGKYENHGWFQQFDSNLTDELIEQFGPSNFKETVFQYNYDGWKISDRASCVNAEYFDVHTTKYFDPKSTIDFPQDYAAGERAVMCLELLK